MFASRLIRSGGATAGADEAEAADGAEKEQHRSRHGNGGNAHGVDVETVSGRAGVDQREDAERTVDQNRRAAGLVGVAVADRAHLRKAERGQVVDVEFAIEGRVVAGERVESTVSANPEQVAPEPDEQLNVTSNTFARKSKAAPKPNTAAPLRPRL